MSDTDWMKRLDGIPVAVEFHDDYVWIKLEDGRVIGNPLTWHTWLANATPEQQSNVELNAFDVWWPALDEGLDIIGMLMGNKSHSLAAEPS